MWFFQKEIDARLELFDRNATQSFDRVKSDIVTLGQWVMYLDQQRQEQGRIIEELRRQIEQVPKTRNDVKLLIDGLYDYEGMNERIRLIEQKVSLLEFQRAKVEQIDVKLQDLPQQLRTIRTQIERMHEERIHDEQIHNQHLVHQESMAHVTASVMPQFEPGTRTSQVSRFKEKVLKKLTQNSKEYVKGLLLSLIQKYGKISGQQLRETIVDEQGLCSKSSFYRLLEELEHDESLTVLAEGKNKVYLQTRKHP